MEGTSYSNDYQVLLVKKLIKKIETVATKYNLQQLSVGIIAPYKQQVTKLLELAKNSKLKIKVCSIDGFQGQECDIAILSTVRSNKQQKLGFLTDFRRLNVGITRGKYSLMIIADVQLISSNARWKRYIDNLNRDGRVYNKTNCEWIQNLIKRSPGGNNIHLDELYDLEPKSSLVRWTVEFEATFTTSYQQLEKNTRSNLKQFLTDQLASGKWSNIQPCHQEILEKYKDIIYQKKFGKKYLFWSIDVNKTDFKQFLRIWNICSHNEINETKKQIQIEFKKYCDNYLELCKGRLTNEKYLPAQWRNIPGYKWYVNGRK